MIVVSCLLQYWLNSLEDDSQWYEYNPWIRLQYCYSHWIKFFLETVVFFLVSGKTDSLTHKLRKILILKLLIWLKTQKKKTLKLLVKNIRIVKVYSNVIIICIRSIKIDYNFFFNWKNYDNKKIQSKLNIKIIILQWTIT